MDANPKTNGKHYTPRGHRWSDAEWDEHLRAEWRRERERARYERALWATIAALLGTIVGWMARGSGLD